MSQSEHKPTPEKLVTITIEVTEPALQSLTKAAATRPLHDYIDACILAHRLVFKSEEENKAFFRAIAEEEYV